MHHRLAIVPLVLLVLAGCGTPDGTLTLSQPQPTLAPPAECKAPISYPGPGTPMPTTVLDSSPTATPITNPRDIPEQAAPLGLGSAPRINDEAAALGAVMAMPHLVAGYDLEYAMIGPSMMEEGMMILLYGGAARAMSADEPRMAFAVNRGSYAPPMAMWPYWSSIHRDGQILWAEHYNESNYRNERGEGVCVPHVSFSWMVEGSGVIYSIDTDSVERRDLLLGAYLEALKSAPPMRELAPLSTPEPIPTFDPSLPPTPDPYPGPPTPTTTPAEVPPPQTGFTQIPYPAPLIPTPTPTPAP